MTVKDLVAIINDEKLYQYVDFYIGDLRNEKDSDVGTIETSNGAQYGIMQISDGTWRSYDYERGVLRLGGIVQTEDESCSKMLYFLRGRKAETIRTKKRKCMPRLYNEDKWLVKKPTFWQRLFGKK